MLCLPSVQQQTLSTARNDFVGQVVSPSWLFSFVYYLGFLCWVSIIVGMMSDLCLGQAIFGQFDIKYQVAGQVYDLLHMGKLQKNLGPTFLV